MKITSLSDELIQSVIEIARKAGAAIMDVYVSDFDIQIKNKSGVKITVGIDGLPVPVLDGELQSISTSPYDTFEILDTTGATAANEIDVFLMGLQMVDIINYTNTQPDFAVWG